MLYSKDLVLYSLVITCYISSSSPAFDKLGITLQIVQSHLLSSPSRELMLRSYASLLHLDDKDSGETIYYPLW